MGKINNVIRDVKKYWKKPKPGEYVSYKEFTSFVLGVSGNNSYTHFIGYITFAAACLLVGSIYGIAFKDIYIIGLIGMPLTFIMTPINMMITDNFGELPDNSKKVVNAICIPLGLVGIACYFVPHYTFENILPALPQILGTILTTSVFNVYFRIFVLKKLSGKFGKFRSWIVAGVVPAVVCLYLIIFLPFDTTKIAYHNKLWILHLLFTLFGIFNAFSAQVPNLQNVISPDTNERAKIISFGSFLFSALPSVVGIILPLIAGLMGNFDNINVYRKIFPIFITIFAAMTLILAFTVSDKVIIEKTYKPKISFIKGSKDVMKNKYFWITNLSTLGACIAAGSVTFINIFFIYVTRQGWLMGIYAAIVGVACVPGMLIAPWLIKKMSKRNLMLLSKVANIMALVGGLWAISKSNTALFIAVNFISTFISSPTSIASQAITPDIWDYQQYLTGERLDGFSGIFPLILTPLTMLGAYLIPALYAAIGFTSDWDIVYVRDYRSKIVEITVIVGVIAHIASMIPFFFYDLTEEKHRKIIEELTERLGQNESEVESEISLDQAPESIYTNH